MRKCPHSVYIAAGDTIAVYCGFCNPDGVPDGPEPMLPHSSADPLNSEKTGRLNLCVQCGNLRTYFDKACRNCGLQFPEDEQVGRQQAIANARFDGMCPKCGSTVHYDQGATWVCADCNHSYAAPRRKCGPVGTTD